MRPTLLLNRLEETMTMLMRGLLVVGLLVGSALGPIDDIVRQLTARIQAMEQLQAKLCETPGLCDETSPLQKMLGALTRAHTRLQAMTSTGEGPQGPNGEGAPQGNGEPGGPNGGAGGPADEAGPNGPGGPIGPGDPNGAGAPQGNGEPNGPYQCSQTCQGDDEGCVPCEPNGPNGDAEPNGLFRCAERCQAGDTDCEQCVPCAAGPNGPNAAPGAAGRKNAGETPLTPFGPFEGQYMCQNRQGACVPCAPFGPNFPEVPAP